MGQFLVSARKYRPTSFKDIVGQSHITTTLKNAIETQQLAHAFLFCGPRGVGKTTCARVLAKTINCLQRSADIEPCNLCASCLRLQANGAMNVYELDAASNNSVEDIRELVDQIRYAPQMGKYKIYIIDEVHMLSNAAFNAFLKTLEEPPHYALFILATTERHKVLPTIVSRCQVFNFNSIKIDDIVKQLEAIAADAAITYERSALQLIAQKAEGAMRDALSMFDLLTTSAGKKGPITYAMARDHLQLLDYDAYFNCTDAFLAGNISTLLSLYNDILSLGFQGNHFLSGLGTHLRNILVCKDSATIPLLTVTDHIRPRYADYAAKCSSTFLLNALKQINQCDMTYKASHHQRLHVELLLIELARNQSYTNDGTTNNIVKQPKTKTSDRIEPLKHTLNHTQSKIPTRDTDMAASSLDHAATADSLATSKRMVNHIESNMPARNTDISASVLDIKKTIEDPYQTTLPLPNLAALKNSLKEQKKNQPATAENNLHKQQTAPILKESIETYWSEYRAQLKEGGNVAGYHLMGQPIEVKGNQITITLINPIQEVVLQNLQEALIDRLRTKLNNKHISLEGIMLPQEKSSKPYTDQEKFIYLQKKNEAIALLQERFKLEITR